MLPALIFVFLFSHSWGQSDTGYTSKRKGPLKSWRLAGISLSAGNNFITDGPRDLINQLHNITSTQDARNKLDTDLNYLNWLKRNEINIYYNYSLNINLRFTLKPRIINWSRLVSFTEISGALAYSHYEWMLEFDRFGEARDSAHFYNASYTSSSKSILAELGYAIQTPGFFGFLSFYTGPRGFAGIPFKTNIYTDSSMYKARDSVSYDLILSRALHNPHNNFAKPSFVAGFAMPIGMKLLLSPRVNIFFEYIISRRTTYFSNGYSSSSWFNGYEFGLRYKLVKEENIPQKDKFIPEDEEVPFY